MTPEVIRQFAEYGGYIGLLMGVLVVMLGGAVVVLWRALLEVQTKRIEESKEVQKEILELTVVTNKVTMELGHAMNALKDAVIMNGRK